jgi:hypothetical protein
MSHVTPPLVPPKGTRLSVHCHAIKAAKAPTLANGALGCNRVRPSRAQASASDGAA